MRCVLFSEQHLQKDFGGCDAQSCMTCGNTLKTFLSGPWPRENGIAVFSCPAYQVRMVFHKCTLFVLPDYYLLMVFFLPSHLLFSWRHCWCMDNWTTWCPPGLQDCRSGHWTAGSSCLEEEWLALASGGRALIRTGDGS